MVGVAILTVSVAAQGDLSVQDAFLGLVAFAACVAGAVAIGFVFHLTTRKGTREGLRWLGRVLSPLALVAFAWALVRAVDYDNTHRGADGKATNAAAVAMAGAFVGVIGSLAGVWITWFARSRTVEELTEEPPVPIEALPQAEPLRSLPPAEHGGPMGFTDDGRHLVIVSKVRRTAVLRVWDVDSPVTVWERRGGLSGRLVGVNQHRDVVAVRGSWWRVIFLSLADGTRRDTRYVPPDSCEFALGPRGRGLAIATNDGRVRIVDLAPGGVTRRMSTKDGDSDVTVLAFSPNGHRVVAASGWSGKIRLWDVATTSIRFVLEHGSWVASVSFAADGAMMATAGRDGTCLVWNPETGQRICAFHHGRTATLAAFHPSGRLLATAGDDGNIVVWSVTTGRPLVRMRHGAPVRHLTGSATGSRLASSSDNLVRIWEWPDDVVALPADLVADLEA